MPLTLVSKALSFPLHIDITRHLSGENKVTSKTMALFHGLHYKVALISFSLLTTMAAVHGRLPRVVFGSSRGFFGLFEPSLTPPPQGGICAGSIAPLGYNCQEFEVRSLLFFSFVKFLGMKLENKRIN